MRRKAVVWQVLSGRLAEYVAAHACLPRPLADEIRALGIRNFSIYHHPGTGQLFAYQELHEPGGTGELAVAEHARWWDEQMRHLLASDAAGTPVEQELDEVFHQD